MTNDNTPQESGKPFAELPQVPRFPRFPDIHVELTGKDGNAFAILGRVARALREAGVDQAVIDGYLKAVMSGDSPSRHVKRLVRVGDRDRGTPRDAAPPTPPGIRVRTTAVRPG